MTEINERQAAFDKTIAGKLRSLAAAARADSDDTPEVRQALGLVADQMEARAASLDPPVEEPQEFGSLVLAWHELDAPDVAADLWQRSPMSGKHYWENANGVIEVWSDLCDPEVLRVGIGKPSDSDDPRLDGAYASGQYAGFDQALEAAHARITSLRGVAITAERKDAYDQSLRIIHELRP